MIGADNVLAQGDGGTIKHGQLPLRQENVGNVGAMAEQDGMGKCRKCRSKVGARWTGKMSEQSWSKVGKKMVYDNCKYFSQLPVVFQDKKSLTR